MHLQALGHLLLSLRILMVCGVICITSHSKTIETFRFDYECNFLDVNYEIFSILTVSRRLATKVSFVSMYMYLDWDTHVSNKFLEPGYQSLSFHRKILQFFE